MRATLGLGTGDAVLEIPLSVTNNSKMLFSYSSTFSQKIQLIYRQRKAGSTEFNRVDKTNGLHVFDPNVEAIQLVARKSSVTKNVQHVHLHYVEIWPAPSLTGNMPLCTAGLL